jgi:hypothetical protein
MLGACGSCRWRRRAVASMSGTMLFGGPAGLRWPAEDRTDRGEMTMKPEFLESTDGGWAKSRGIVSATVEWNSSGETRLKPTTWRSGLQVRGGVRLRGRLALALGSVWVLVAFWVYPAHGWWRTIPGRRGSSDSVNAAVRDAAGDVIAVGRLSGDFGVVKFSGATGEELWRQEIVGTGGGGQAQGVAVDGSGDAIAVGRVYNGGTGDDFTVIKFSGATGEELWRREIAGAGTENDEAQAVAVDGSGDVIAAGSLYKSVTTGGRRESTGDARVRG